MRRTLPVPLACLTNESLVERVLAGPALFEVLMRRHIRLSPVSGHTLMMIVGVVEIAAGILVAVRPRIGAYIIMARL